MANMKRMHVFLPESLLLQLGEKSRRENDRPVGALIRDYVERGLADDTARWQEKRARELAALQFLVDLRRQVSTFGEPGGASTAIPPPDPIPPPAGQGRGNPEKRLVVDAGVVTALALPVSYSDQAARKMGEWLGADREVCAPVSLGIQVMLGLRKAMQDARLSLSDAGMVMQAIAALNICELPAGPEWDGALRWVDQLKQATVYQAACISLAEALRIDYWTADQGLARFAAKNGMPYVRWIGEESEENP